MPHPCSHWAVRTFGKEDLSRKKFDAVTDIMSEFRAELNSEEGKLGRPDLPKLTYELTEIDTVKKKTKAAKPTATAEPAFSASAIDGAATVSDDAWAEKDFAVGVTVREGARGEDITIEKVEGQAVTLKSTSGTMTTTRTAVMEKYVVHKTVTKATRWVPMRVRCARRRRRRGTDVYSVIW